MTIANRTSFAAPLAALLLLAAPAGARSGGEAATTTVADPTMPAMLRLALIQSRAGEVDSAYHVDGNGRGTNPRHDLGLAFTPAGVRIVRGDGGFALRLERFGRGAGLPVRRATPRIDGAWVEYDRGAGLTEWFVNLPCGVEQGWTVAERPAGGGPLVLELDTARPPDDNGDRGLAWSGLVYHRLVALDADGRELPAAWTHDGARLRIEVDDRDAAYPLLVDPWVQQARLTADDGAFSDSFGHSVALAGDTAVVGAPFADVDDNISQGAVYVFIHSNGVWNQHDKLVADDGVGFDNFGWSVALEGDTALLGARSADVDGNNLRGAAYVFTRSGGAWSQQAKLTADDGAAEDVFGASVALAGDTALVGAPLADVDGNVDQGAAYAFTRSGSTWSQQDKLAAADGGVEDEFGHSVALAGDTALVGAHRADVDGNDDQGAAYVFTRSDGVWSQLTQLAPTDTDTVNIFGRSVALVGDTALVGATGTAVDGDVGRGAVYVFTGSGDTWNQQARLTAEDGGAGDLLGFSVALAGDTALVGAEFATVDGNGAQGAAYVFTRSEGVWSQRAKLLAEDGTEGDQFGYSVALAGDSGLVGAFTADVDGTILQGAAYVFTLVEPELSFNPVSLDFGDVELGTSEALITTLENSGDGDATGLDFTLSGVGFEADTSACGESLPSGGSCPVTVTFSPAETGPASGSLTAASTEGAATDLGLAGNGVRKTEVFSPTALVVDPKGGDLSDGNHVFEPGERVEVGPTWRNDGEFPQLLTGTAADFTGPEGAVYTLVLDVADYGEVVPGGTASCVDAEMCYQMEVGPSGIPRPATHWDTGFDETLSDDTAKTWTLHIGDSFTDVPRASLFYRSIETLLHHGVSGDPLLARLQLPLLGCSETAFCPAAAVTRAEAAVFLLKGLEGGGFDPQDCASGSERFADVSAEDPFCPWIEELARRGVTAGCGDDNFCPDAAVTRAQIAVLLLKTAEGPDYVPPECSGVFDDVPCPSPFADWIEDLFVRGLTAGCGGGNYCPNQPITRAQLATFIARTFGLVLYGP